MVETFAVEQAEAFEGCVHDFHQTVNKGHGRIETHRGWAMDTPEYIRYVDPDRAWPDLCSLVMIEAQRRQGKQVVSETRYYSIRRRLALNLLRRETTAKGGIASRRKQAGWNNEYLLKVLSN